MEFGVSSACFYPEYTEKALKWIVEHGIANTEIFVNSDREISKKYRNIYQNILKHGQTNVLSVHPWQSVVEPFWFFTGYERRFEDGIEVYKQYFEFQNELNAKILVFHGDRRDGLLSKEEYFERFARLRKVAKEYGIILAQENVARCRSGSPSFIKEMRKYLNDEVEFVLDLKQTIRANSTPMEMAAAMGTRIVHIHVSDHAEGEDCLPPGKGKFDLKNFFMQNNLQCAAIIELYRSSYQTKKDITKSYKYLCDLDKYV